MSFRIQHICAFFLCQCALSNCQFVTVGDQSCGNSSKINLIMDIRNIMGNLTNIHLTKDGNLNYDERTHVNLCQVRIRHGICFYHFYNNCKCQLLSYGNLRFQLIIDSFTRHFVIRTAFQTGTDQFLNVFTKLCFQNSNQNITELNEKSDYHGSSHVMYATVTLSVAAGAVVIFVVIKRKVKKTRKDSISGNKSGNVTHTDNDVYNMNHGYIDVIDYNEQPETPANIYTDVIDDLVKNEIPDHIYEDIDRPSEEKNDLDD